MTTSKPSTTELAAQGQLFVELIAAEDDAVDARVLDAAAELMRRHLVESYERVGKTGEAGNRPA